MNCQNVRSRLHLYVDGELQPAEALSVESHLADCVDCRQEHDALVAVVESVRAARPLYPASEDSFRNVKAMCARRCRRIVIQRWAIAASIFLVSLLAFSTMVRREGSPNRFAAFAAESHLRYSRGSLPLDIRTGQPGAVASWLSARLPFHLTLPNYPEQIGESKRYSLVGARLLQYQEEDVAYLAYEMDQRPISLLIASSAKVVPAGGDVYKSGGLSFHMTAEKGLRMITWIDKGLSYALVSELDVAGAESCAICHGTEADRQKFEPLRPRL